MKKLTLFIEDDFIKILNEFKEKIGEKNLEDEKAIVLITRLFMEKFNKNNL